MNLPRNDGDSRRKGHVKTKLDLKGRTWRSRILESYQKLGCIYKLHQQGSDFGSNYIVSTWSTPCTWRPSNGACRHRFVSSVVTCSINTYRIIPSKDSKSHDNCSLNSHCFWRRVKGRYSQQFSSIKVRRSTGIGMIIQEQSQLLLHLVETFKPNTT